MKKNIGSPDKIIRILLAIIFVILYLTNVVTGTFGIILLIVSGLLVITSFMGICPLYMILKISSAKK